MTRSITCDYCHRHIWYQSPGVAADDGKTLFVSRGRPAAPHDGGLVLCGRECLISALEKLGWLDA